MPARKQPKKTKRAAVKKTAAKPAKKPRISKGQAKGFGAFLKEKYS